MYRLAYRNFGSYESLVVNHSVAVGTTRKNTYVAVRWYELRNLSAATPTVYQQAPDAPNTLSNETTVIQGNGSQLTNLSRWGDYSAMSVDPVDDCTFWYTSEYLPANGTFNWTTRIASFKIAGCQ